MRSNKYLFTYNDIRAHFSSFSTDSYSTPFLKPGKSSWPPASNQCLSWDDLKAWLLWSQGYTETKMPTWDDARASSTIYGAGGSAYGTDAWGFEWTEWYISLYTTSPPHTNRATNIDLDINPGEAAAIIKYSISGNWWSETNTHWMWRCKRKSDGAIVYGCFNETRPGADDCSNQTTSGNILRTVGNASPKGCIVALVPYGEWIEEVAVADNVSGTDGEWRYDFKWVIIPWPY